MNILIINTFYYPNMIGGTEHSVKLLAEELVKRKNNVAIYTIDSEKKIMQKENINGVCVYRGTGGIFDLKARQENTKNYYIKIKNRIIEKKNITISKEFNKVIEEFNPNIIHTNNLYGISPIVWKIAKEKKIPIVHTIRDYWILNPIVNEKEIYSIVDKVKIKIQQMIFRKESNKVDYVTAPSKFTLNKLLENNYFKNSEHKSVVNAVNLELKETKKYIENRRKDNNKLVNFIFVGALIKNKGIDILLEVFSKIKNKNIKLNIFGSGDLESIVNSYVEKDKRINYHGQVDSTTLKKEWLNNDVAIVPSIWEEPFGRVVIEANQFGLPVIGSNKGGIKEILETINTGEIYKFNDKKELKKKIMDFSKREKIKEFYDNIENNINKYSVKTQIDEFLKIYDKLIRRDEKI